MNFKNMSNLEIASFISQELSNIGIKTTLSGGFAVETYTNKRYVSEDIDLVDQSVYRHADIDKKMKELGFVKLGKIYKHKDMKYTIEFPSSPLAVGDEIINDVEEIKTEYGNLRIITPTDCVKDRLAIFFHWEDKRGLEQAILVAIENDVNFENIKEWATNEGEIKKFNIFYEQYQERILKELDKDIPDTSNEEESTINSKRKLR